MGYIIRGNLSASLFPDIRESVGGAQVLIYSEEGQDRAKAGSKAKLRPLPQREIGKKRKLMVGETRTDAKGYYEVVLNGDYKNQSLGIDVRLEKVPLQKITKHKPLQFHLGCLKPVWHPFGSDFTYSYSYNFSFENWYRIRRIFDAWTICGTVKPKGMGGAGLIVTAMDVDWIQDDLIGRGVTDEKGFFRIDYNSSDFKKTFLSPLINIETPITAIPGPGVYFKVQAANGTVLYEEKSAVGHTPPRKNIPHCYFMELSFEYVGHKVI